MWPGINRRTPIDAYRRSDIDADGRQYDTNTQKRKAIAMDPPGWFPLIVRGGAPLNTTYQGGILTVRFRKSPVKAGDPTKYGHMPHGSAAWLDRPVNNAEPSVVKEQMNDERAAEVRSVLRNGERFWKFVCRNTNTGHFEVLRSEPDAKQVIIDQP